MSTASFIARGTFYRPESTDITSRGHGHTARVTIYLRSEKRHLLVEVVTPASTWVMRLAQGQVTKFRQHEMA